MIFDCQRNPEGGTTGLLNKPVTLSTKPGEIEDTVALSTVCRLYRNVTSGDKQRVQRRVQGEQKRMIIVAVTFSGRCHFEILEKSETVDAERYKRFS